MSFKEDIYATNDILTTKRVLHTDLEKMKCACGGQISHRLSLTLHNSMNIPYTVFFYLCESCADKNKHDLKVNFTTRPSYLARIRNKKTGVLYAEELANKRNKYRKTKK